MNTRDSKGRFAKKEDENYLHLAIPSLKTFLSLFFITLVFMPWIIIISKLHPFDRMEFLFAKIFGYNASEESESPKKMDYSIK